MKYSKILSVGLTSKRRRERANSSMIRGSLISNSRRELIVSSHKIIRVREGGEEVEAEAEVVIAINELLLMHFILKLTNIHGLSIHLLLIFDIIRGFGVLG